MEVIQKNPGALTIDPKTPGDDVLPAEFSGAQTKLLRRKHFKVENNCFIPLNGEGVWCNLAILIPINPKSIPNQHFQE